MLRYGIGRRKLKTQRFPKGSGPRGTGLAIGDPVQWRDESELSSPGSGSAGRAGGTAASLGDATGGPLGPGVPSLAWRTVLLRVFRTGGAGGSGLIAAAPIWRR